MPSLSFSESLIHVARSASNVFARTAPTQGGLLQGQNPAAVNTTDPIRLWVIQLFIIICFTQLLGLLLGRMRQPKVISEVIGGILLGPTAMGRIPGFTNAIFNPLSIPYLNLTANIGLVLFLFVVGLEVDTRLIKRNARASLAISAAGMILPFGLGAALAVPMYTKYIDTSLVSFGNYLLFAGVAMSITAFPVLCRILTETKLLSTAVGSVTLAAGVGNDLVGWILLALTVALVNASTGVMAVYVLLCVTGWALFLLFPVKWGFRWLARKTGSFESGPTPFMMTLTLLLVFASAFFTDVIGVHAIFGGFLAGLTMPHDGGFNIALLEKFEDLVSLLLLPLYFTLSGLQTDLGLLDRAVDWGYIVALCVIAFVGKFTGCASVAAFFGFNWRESSAIGTLMSCKGLVELIVLNVGLSAGILDTRIFSMFVVEAIVLTFMTTPLTLLFYPEKYRTSTGETALVVEEKTEPAPRTTTFGLRSEERIKSRITVVLNKMEHLPALMMLTQLLQPAPGGPAQSFGTRASSIDESDKYNPAPTTLPSLAGLPTLLPGLIAPTSTAGATPVRIDALRLIELTERASALFKASVTDDLVRSDPLVNVFRTYGHLNRIPVSASLAVVNYDSFSSSVSRHVAQHGSDLVVIPWGPQAMGTSVLEQAQTGASGTTSYSGPLANLFGSTPSTSAPANSPSSLLYSQFARRVFAEAPADVALFIDRGLGPSETAGGYGQHVFFPFFGGPDDRTALAFVVQLCAHPAISATVVRVTKSDLPTEVDLETPAPTHHTGKDNIASTLNAGMTVHSTHYPDTVYGHNTTQFRLASSAADDIAWETVARPEGGNDALTRVSFSTLASSQPLHVLAQRAHHEERSSGSWKSLVIVVGRGRRLATESHHGELSQMLAEHGRETSINSDIRKTIGDVASAFVVSGSRASLLVMQSHEAQA
ncbi:cation/H+ exchanger [Calocera viscosa TUFC12733]|uniref:Cation/H+ exchanger n=1 Tax=Calocera viscosa (strain TUFC12733) TaxID=1330018 RepID=A0A167QQT5_CALVF|nr:cation/H+ exchanger [Calocera viscosa TUFC12733]